MGGKVSVELDVQGPQSHQDNVLHGTLILTAKRPVSLERAARVALQLRVKLITIKGRDKKEESIQEVWKVGDDVAPRGTKLNAGENRFSFSFPLDGKLQQELPPAIDWAKKFGHFTFLEYEYVLRGGSPPQTKDIVLYPKLLKPSDNGIRQIGRHGVDELGAIEGATEILASILGA
mmetsp:Transcript_4534/g.9137  ORF Transcript_4534/g.9137 Transcript_4534/m.9137 type:complete len:176 (+) Transcript_4534:82-609(+)|eukprot:scaffold15321_cov174-Amphora_coffeaeformis.AAC.1